MLARLQIILVVCLAIFASSIYEDHQKWSAIQLEIQDCNDCLYSELLYRIEPTEELTYDQNRFSTIEFEQINFDSNFENKRNELEVYLNDSDVIADNYKGVILTIDDSITYTNFIEIIEFLESYENAIWLYTGKYIVLMSEYMVDKNPNLRDYRESFKPFELPELY